jgi:hypothetical protein
MKFFATLLTLVAVASAIDLYGHSDTNCGGNYGVCSNMEPNRCCGASGGSVAARGIPIGWRVEVRSYTGGACTNLAQIIGNGASQSFVCVRGGFFTGVGYNFYGRKRDDGAVDQSECAKPDTLVLTDGTQYDLTGLADEEFDAV